MQKHYHADWRNAADGIETLLEQTDGHEEAKLMVYDGEAVMRGITTDEMSERNLVGNTGDPMCTIKYDGIKLTVYFHQSVVGNTLQLDVSDGRTLRDQATDIRQLAPVLAPVPDRLEEVVTVQSYDFAGVEAASIGGGGQLTDWEFEYEVLATGI